MRSGIILALLVSLVLVGGASWSRYSPQKNELELVTDAAKPINFQEIYSGYAAASTSSPPVNSTDLVGRQLIADYVALASQGQVSESNLNSLSEKYIESIPTLIAFSLITPADLIIVSDTQDNFKNYSGQILSAYQDYASGLIAVEMGGGMKSFSIDSNYTRSTAQMGKLYGETALAIKKISVPASIVQNHLELINLYLKNSAALLSMSKAENDPASAFAGLVVLSSNIGREAELWATVEKMLNENGV